MERIGSDTIVTGSDDGNLRVWSLSRNQVGLALLALLE